MDFLRIRHFHFDEEPVRLEVQPRGKTKRGWETFITKEAVAGLRALLGRRLQHQDDLPVFESPQRPGEPVHHVSMTLTFRTASLRPPPMNEVIYQGRQPEQRRYKYHLYSLKKFFETQVTMAHNGDRSMALAWEGRKAYLDDYLRLSLDERRELYRRAEPRLLIFQSQPTEDELTQKLKAKGFSKEQIEGLKELDLMPRG